MNKSVRILPLFILILLFPCVFSQETDTLEKKSLAIPGKPVSNENPSDSAETKGPKDTSDQVSYSVVKRKKDYNKLLGGAIAMMLFIGIVMGTEQNWNP